ncbi:MAG: PQQ-binding-like beta-propeller repeat protein [Myxococcales bacterium]|nr:PQQ-binding-like beta-propeller repeat protein [Myxococcales bacterium]
MKLKRFVALASTLAAVGCGESVSPGPQDAAAADVAAPTDTGAGPVDAGADAGPLPTGGVVAVTTFQFDNARTGANRSETVLTPAALRARALGRDTAFSPSLDGEVYAQPLVLPRVSVSGGARDLLFVTTQANSVYALDAATGAEVWRVSLGTPAPRSMQPCGNISPTTGVLGTPVIDAAAGTLYAVSYNNDGGLVFKLHALDVTSGAERAGFPVALQPPTSNGVSFNAAPQQQRGALALVNGRVYVPFGGLYGDCGLYHGWVVAIDPANPASQMAFATPGRGSGIWAPAGESVDEEGRLYVATGNSTPLGGHTPGSLGEYILRIGTGAMGPSFTESDTGSFFSPSDARSLDLADLDIGSTAPVVVPPVMGLSARLVFQVGKAGVAYLADRASLGGTGSALFSNRIFAGGVYGATAAWSNGAETYVYAPGRGRASGCSANGGVMALRVTAEGGGRFATAWCSATVSNPSPPAISSNGNSDGVVWVAGTSPASLRAIEASTGMELFTDTLPSVRQWVPVVVSGGRVYVTGRNTVSMYRFQ